MLNQIFTMIFEEFNSGEDTMFKDEIMASMVRILIQYLFRIKSRKELNKEGLRYRNLYRNFIDAIENNFREIHSVSEYAELLYVSEKTINRSCKALTQNRIDFEAKRMLVREDVNIKQIGYDLGFKSSSHFNKYFKNINSITPGSFRKNVLD